MGNSPTKSISGRSIRKSNKEFQSVVPYSGEFERNSNPVPLRRASEHSDGSPTLTTNHLISSFVKPTTNDTQSAATVSIKKNNHSVPITGQNRNETEFDHNLTEGQSRRNMIADCESECSQISEYLFVGGIKVASSLRILEQHGITNIVNCCSMVVDDYFIKDPKIKYLRLNLVDGRDDDINWFITDVINFIESARLREEKTLIHCEKGISRSCSMAIGYLMWSSGDSWNSAFNYVKSRRPICAPNTGFTCNLIELNDLISGEARQVALLFRCSSHLPHDMDTPVLKLCRETETRKIITPKLSLLDPRGVFVVRPKTSNDSTIYVWQGSEAHPEVADIAYRLARRLLTVLCTTKFVEMVYSGIESAEFLSSIINDEPHNASKHPTYQDLYRCQKREDRSKNNSSTSSSLSRPPSACLKSELHILDIEDDEESASRHFESTSTSTSRSNTSCKKRSAGVVPLSPLVTQSLASEIEESRRKASQQLQLHIDRSLLSLPLTMQLNTSPLQVRNREIGSDATDGENTVSHSSHPSTTVQRKDKPLLFRAQPIVPNDYLGAYQWHAMGVYDDDDLDEESVLLLLCPQIPHHLWVGKQAFSHITSSRMSPDLSSSTFASGDGEDVDRVMLWCRTIALGELKSVDVTVEEISDLELQIGGEETSLWWEQFEKGF